MTEGVVAGVGAGVVAGVDVGVVAGVGAGVVAGPDETVDREFSEAKSTFEDETDKEEKVSGENSAASSASS